MSKTSSQKHQRRGHAGPGSRAHDAEVPRPSFAERARTLLYRQPTGYLSTLSKHQPGFPFGSVMPFALTALGDPLFLISKMAMHTQNLDRDPRTSLLVTDPSVLSNPLGSARVTLVGSASPVPEEELGSTREIYLASHESARYWVDYADFGFYRLTVESLYFVGGFGEMGWVEVEDFRRARPDPLADAEQGIVAHMNDDHADALALLAAKFGGIEAESAVMTSLDRLGFHLRLSTTEGSRGCRIAFPREASTAEEVREIIVQMVKGARAGTAV